MNYLFIYNFFQDMNCFNKRVQVLDNIHGIHVSFLFFYLIDKLVKKKK